MLLKKIKQQIGILLAMVPLCAMAGVPFNSSQKTMRVLSYNVENLFDTIDDPTTNDAEFLPSGSRQWSERRYQKKIQQITSVIAQAGEWHYPALVALIEVENSSVVEELVKEVKLRKADYSFAVSQAADPRGIDVALLWMPQHFELVEAREIPHYGSTLYYPLRQDQRKEIERSGSGRNTLWVTLQERSTGALFDIFVVHAPSRRGGVRATSKQRERVLHKVRRVVDSLLAKRTGEHHIIIMGDFNDNPNNQSLHHFLQAKGLPARSSQARNNRLYNMGYPLLQKRDVGSHYHEGRYWLPDQIILSGSLLNGRSKIKNLQNEMQIYAPEWLRDGLRPKRTYQGEYYKGGYSDHFPVYIDLVIQSEDK